MATVGQLIRARRTKANLSQRALGDRVGVDHMTVSRWERDVHHPTRAHRHLLAEILGGRPADYRGPA